MEDPGAVLGSFGNDGGNYVLRARSVADELGVEEHSAETVKCNGGPQPVGWKVGHDHGHHVVAGVVALEAVEAEERMCFLVWPGLILYWGGLCCWAVPHDESVVAHLAQRAAAGVVWSAAQPSEC
eukprot:4291576-Heterocapsa_arctica.AAC.1